MPLTLLRSHPWEVTLMCCSCFLLAAAHVLRNAPRTSWFTMHMFCPPCGTAGVGAAQLLSDCGSRASERLGAPRAQTPVTSKGPAVDYKRSLAAAGPVFRQAEADVGESSHKHDVALLYSLVR